MAEERAELEPMPPLNSTHLPSTFWDNLILAEPILDLWNILDKFHIDLRKGILIFLSATPATSPTPIMLIGRSLSTQTSETAKDWHVKSLIINPLKIEQTPRMSIGIFTCQLNPPDPRLEGPSEFLLKIARFITFSL